MLAGVGKPLESLKAEGIPGPLAWEVPPTRVPAGYLVLLNENAEWEPYGAMRARDARTVGLVHVGQVLGKVSP